MNTRRTRLTFSFILSFFVFSNITHAQNNWDWYISGGTIVDGTGAPAYQADILIRGGHIGYIGAVNADTIRAKHRVDASGKIVSPGFIDVHAHGNPMKTPEFRNFLAMGVTTIVLGQDGSSPRPGSLNEWFAQVSEANPGVNIAVLSGHGSIRAKVGVGKTAPTVQELRRMERLLRSDLEAGAFGMSTGLEYVPGLYADEAELTYLAKIVGEYDAIVMSHMRSEDNAKIETSLDELAAQGEYAKVHASHLKVVYGKNAERADEILSYIDSLRKQVIEFTADTYPYAASYTGISIVFPKWAKTNKGWKNALKERPAMLRTFLKNKVAKRNGPDAILFGSGEFAGMTLKEAALQEGISPVDLLLERGPQFASGAHFVMNQALQDRIVAGKKVMISSDGSPTMWHPRGYGSFAKVIRRYVIEKETLTIEEAVHKMSGLSAQTLGLEKRGVLKEGNKADILIFDLSEVRDVATFEEPHQLAEGFDWIMVNGQLAGQNGEFSKERFGEMLKRN
ncbi:MAG TPA: amidohydrolase family protein [Balneolaceae bacterium]|nr:amidohydrolase family protein [Balneolaceae bacterium]